MDPTSSLPAIIRFKNWPCSLFFAEFALIAWATGGWPESPAACLFAAQPGTNPGASQITSADVSPRAAEAIPAKVRRYAEHLLRRYDTNGDGQLQPEEWGKMHGHPETADTNGDRMITLDELTKHIAAFGQNRRVRLTSPAIGGDAEMPGQAETGSDRVSTNGSEDAKKTAAGTESPPGLAAQPRRDTTFFVPKSRLPAGLPEWFLRRDTNGDGQLSLSEFAPNPTQADLEEFARYDRNGDGFITAQEYLNAVKPAKAASGKGTGPGKTEEKGGAKASRKKSGATGN